MDTAALLEKTGAEEIESETWLREFADRYAAAWNTHDVEAVAACMAEDVTFEDPTMRAPARGRNEVARFARETFNGFPDIHVEQTEPLLLSDDRLLAVSPWLMAGTNTGPIEDPGLPATGKRFAIEGVGLWRFRGGLLWRYRDVYDTTDLARQLGLMPPRGSRGERMLVLMQRLRGRMPGGRATPPSP
jgi:steroid delta-isomerase-like uncharacterized protein